MRLVWVGDWANTGLGQITQHVVPLLQAQGHEVTVLGIVCREPQAEPVKVIPVSGPHPQGGWTDIWGFNSVPGLIEQIRPDAVVFSHDTWVCDMWLNSLTYRPRTVVLTPIDSLVRPDLLRTIAGSADVLLTYTQWGADQFTAVGRTATACHLGVDERFVPGDRDAARKALGLPLDKFIIGSIAGNGWRKDHPALLEAFDAVRRERDDAMLLLVSKSRGYWDLPHLVTFAEHADDIIHIGEGESLTTEAVVTLTQACDVVAYPTRGEGWGIPVSEAMRCGIPVVATDFAATAEQGADGRAQLVPPLRHDTDNVSIGWFAVPDPTGFATAILAGPTDGQIEKAREWSRALTWERCASQIEAALCG